MLHKDEWSIWTWMCSIGFKVRSWKSWQISHRYRSWLTDRAIPGSHTSVGHVYLMTLNQQQQFSFLFFYLPEGDVTVSVGVRGQVTTVRGKRHGGDGTFVTVDVLEWKQRDWGWEGRRENVKDEGGKKKITDHEITQFFPHNKKESKCILFIKNKNTVNLGHYFEFENLRLSFPSFYFPIFPNMP